MSDRNDFFSRLAGRVDLRRLDDAFVIVIGAGSVGSELGFELARCGVRHLGFVDGDRLELHNVPRHVLPSAYVGTNKAEGMATHLRLSIPDLDVAALPRYVDDSLSDLELDRLLAPADLVVIATDSREVQRRVARRALALDAPALVPGLYDDRGGEVFVQLASGQACFRCWDDFRESDAEVRGATSVNADALPLVQQAVFLALALLDPSSRHARELAPPPNDPRPRQLFVLHPGAALIRAAVARRPGCGSCAVGPSPLNGGGPRTVGPGGARGHFASGATARDAAAGWGFALEAPAQPPAIDRVEVSERLVVEGGTVVLSWIARNSTHVEVETVGRRPPGGQVEVAVRATGALRVVAVNPFGRREALSPVVRVMPLPRLRPFDLPASPVGIVPQLTPPSLASLHWEAAPRGTPDLASGLEFPGWPAPLFPGKAPWGRES